MSTQNKQVISSISNYSSEIIRVLNELLEILNVNKITLTFDTGVDDLVVNPIIVYRGQSFGKLPEPIRPGYDFLGWFLTKTTTVFNEEVYSNEISDYSEVLLDSSVTLYAKWDFAKYRIELNPVGGTVYPTYVNGQYQQKFEGKDYFPKANKIGYDFEAWQSITGHNSNEPGFSCDFYGDPLSAIYRPKTFELSFLYDYSGLSNVYIKNPEEEGKYVPAALSCHLIPSLSNNYPSLSVLSVSTLETRFFGDITDFARNNLSAIGYRFRGWAESKNNPDLITMIRPVANTILYAYWEPIPYKVKYTLNGAVLSGENEIYGIPFGIPPTDGIFDPATATRLSCWKYENVWGNELGDLQEKQYVANMVSSYNNPEYIDLSAELSSTGYLPNSTSAEAIVNLVKNPGYNYVLSDDIHVSAFRALVYFSDGKFRWRTPLSVVPNSFGNSSSSNTENVTNKVTFYCKENLGDNWKSGFEYQLSGIVPHYPEEYVLLSSGVKTEYKVGDYPNLGKLQICVIDNYKLSTYNYNYGYSPTGKFETFGNGEFLISAFDDNMNVVNEDNPWRIGYKVDREVESLSVTFNHGSFLSNYTEGQKLSIDGVDVYVFYKELAEAYNLKNILDNDETYNNCFNPLSGTRLSTYNNSVTVTYQEHSVSYPISVSANVGTFELTHYPNNIFYRIGEEFNQSGVSGVMSYLNVDDGGRKYFNVYDDDIVSYSKYFYTPGVNTIRVYYEDSSDVISNLVVYENLINKFELDIQQTATICDLSGLKCNTIYGGEFAVCFGDGTKYQEDNEENEENRPIGEPTKKMFESLSFGTYESGFGKHTYSTTGNYIVSVFSEYPENNILSLELFEDGSANIPFSSKVLKVYGNVPVNFFGKNDILNNNAKIELENDDSISMFIIGERAFKDSKLSSVSSIPSTVKEIREEAFYNAINLTKIGPEDNKIKIEGDLETIGDKSFSKTKAKIVDVSNCNKLSSIGSEAFSSCDLLETIDFGQNSTFTFGDKAFSNCKKLKEVFFPPRFAGMGPMAFQDCKSLSSVMFNDQSLNFQAFSEACFSGCSSLISVGNFPNNVQSLPTDIFNNCSSLISFDFRETNLTSFGDGCFRNCSSLSTIYLPTSLKSVGFECFKSNTSLSSIFIPSNLLYIGINAFDRSGCNNVLTINFQESESVVSTYTLLSDLTPVGTLTWLTANYEQLPPV